MHLNYIKFEPENTEHCELISKWKNDPDIRFLLEWHKDEEAAKTISTPEMVRQRSLNVPPPEMYGERYMIVCDKQIIGDTHFSLGVPHVVTKDAKVAWLGIGIGEKSFHGKGIGRKSMLFVEDRARQNGAEIFELGVFEFNMPAMNLYKSLGYKEVTRIPQFTWFNNQMWADIRMTKPAN